jgi:hypothetical protein
VLDGRTGRVLRGVSLPQMAPEIKDRPYELNIGDSLLFVDLSSAGGPRDILLKDRYRGFWIFNKDLELVSEGTGQTGHYPFPIDTDADGRQEFLIGYSLWQVDSRNDSGLEPLGAGELAGRRPGIRPALREHH